MEEIVKEEKYIKYCGIKIDTESIRLIELDRVVNVVPKGKISQINIIKGSTAKRPWVVVLIGITLIAMGSYAIPAIIRFVVDGAPMSKGIVILPIWGALGVMLLFEVLTKRFILHICTEKGEERIKFESKAQKQLIEEFLKLANTQYGYNIHSLTDEITL